jgi:dienelactone hydrolase
MMRKLRFWLLTSIWWFTQSVWAQYGLPSTLQAELPFGKDLSFSVATSPLTSTTPLNNSVFIPSGNAGVKYPALVLHHTCGGISEHIYRWSEAALREGFVVLVLDTLSTRGMKSDCDSPSKIPNGRWIKDQLDAIAFLAAQPFVDPKAISTLGFSKGGLASTWLSSASVANALRSEAILPAATVSLYALCALPPTRGRPQGIVILQQDATRPLLMLMGEKDNETSPQSCLRELPLRKGAGAPVEWHVYPDTTHAWDKSEQDGFSKASPISGEVVVYRYNRQATEDARKRVFSFLNQYGRQR